MWVARLEGGDGGLTNGRQQRKYQSQGGTHGEGAEKPSVCPMETSKKRFPYAAHFVLASSGSSSASLSLALKPGTSRGPMSQGTQVFIEARQATHLEDGIS